MTTIFRIFSLSLLMGLPIYAQNNPEKKKSTSPAEPPSIGEQISRHINTLAQAERDKRMDFMYIVIDDITRLCKLKVEQRDKLILAAKGSAERSMKRWHEQAERYFRSRVGAADSDSAKEILANIGTVNFGSRGSDGEGEAQSLWKESLKNTLNETQVKKYEGVVESRKQARIDAFSQMAVASLDEYLRLTPVQKSKLTPIVKQSANENLDEVRRYWGDYLEKNMLMSLVNVADKETLSAVLSDKQYERLQGATSNLEHFWENRRRINKAKETAEAKKEEAKAEVKPKAAAVKIEGKVKAGQIQIKAGKGGVIIKKGAIIRSGNITIDSDNIQIEE